MSDKTKTGLLALLLTACLVGVLALILLRTNPRQTAGPTRQPVPMPKQPAELLAADAPYPYPECAACLEYLKKRAREPDSLQVVEWLGREDHATAGWEEGRVRVRVRVRARNGFGGWTNQVTWLNLFHGEVKSHVNLSD